MALDKSKLNVETAEGKEALAEALTQAFIQGSKKPVERAHDEVVRSLMIAVSNLQLLADNELKSGGKVHPATQLDMTSMVVGFLTGRVSQCMGVLRELGTGYGHGNLLKHWGPEGLALSSFIEDKLNAHLNGKTQPMVKDKYEDHLDARIKAYHPESKGLDGKQDESFLNRPTDKKKMN